METIFIDHVPYQVKEGQNLLQAVLSLRLDLPYFCWHPALGSVGACRQCAVKLFRDEKDARGRLVMACMMPATNGTRISIEDAEAREFRASVAEWMMINHPHDCPVCDEGGECHLQDMVVMTGHTFRRYRGLKRTFHNQDLGPFINHEMNRCIQCYRCVRFYRDYAGGRDLDAFASRDQVYFGRAEDGTLENEFSGNLVEVCPTGVFTDKTFKEHFTRKWDLQTAPSICVNCGLGCNTLPGERSGQLRRIRNRYNGEVNGYFLCDRGRYGYEFVNSEWRICQPQGWSDNKTFGSLTKDAALQRAASLLSKSAQVIGVGSPRASLEANFALRTLVGPEHFYLGMSETEHRLVSRMIEILRNGPARSPSLHEVESADAVLVLGEDVTNVAPMLALALRQSVRRKPIEIAAGLRIPEWDDASVRQAAQNAASPLFLATPYTTRLEDVATETCLAAPDDLARLGFAVAHELNPAATAVAGLSDKLSALAARVAQVLKSANRPLIVSGPSCGNEAVIQAAANVAWALCTEGHAAELCFTVPESNSVGLGLMGGGSLADAFKAVRDGNADTVVILENDLYRRADVAVVNAMLQVAKHVIVLDHLTNATTSRAELALPAATFAEGDGTLVNSEGRAQRFYQVYAPQEAIQASWRWIRDAMMAAGRPEAEAWRTLDDVTAAMAGALPVFEPVMHIAPPAGFRVEGLKIPRQSHRYSGRTALTANISMHEPQPPNDPDSPLAFSMEGFEGEPPSSLIPRFWAPGWNSVQSVNKFQQEIGGPLQGGDPGQRLIEPAQVEKPSYFADVPPAFKPRRDEWLAIPIYHIFGSEELSMLTPAVAERAPQRYAGVGATDAALLRATEGRALQVQIDGTVRVLPAKPMPGLPRGLIGLPSGLPGMQDIVMPTWARVMPHEGMS